MYTTSFIVSCSMIATACIIIIILFSRHIRKDAQDDSWVDERGYYPLVYFAWFFLLASVTAIAWQLKKHTSAEVWVMFALFIIAVPLTTINISVFRRLGERKHKVNPPAPSQPNI